MSNTDFMNRDFHCNLCGARDLVPSKITLEANYGSGHDGEQITLYVCGNCMDWLFDTCTKRGEYL